MESSVNSTIDNKCSQPEVSPTEFDRDAKFLAMLPRIRRQAAYYLRRLPIEDRADAVQEVVACAFVSWVRLHDQGKSDVAYAGPLARYGACQYRSGRRVGNRLNGHDVTSHYCRRRNGIMVEQLDHFDDPNDEWQEIVVEDRHAGPADVATTRLDFRAWLTQLTRRTRKIAKDLARGYSTAEVACKHGLSASRISQLRRELHDAWLVFTGEKAVLTSSVLD